MGSTARRQDSLGVPSCYESGVGEARDLPRWAFGVLALLPFALLPLHSELGHRGDVVFFDAWCAAVREGAAFYRDGPGINYPIVGVGLVCLPEAFGDLPFETFRLVLKATLALAETLTIFALAALARGVGARRPHAIALGTWAIAIAPGGAFFGQIDVWGTLWMTLAWLAVVRTTQRARDTTGDAATPEAATSDAVASDAAASDAAASVPSITGSARASARVASDRRRLALGVLAALAFTLALLTKQLALFSLPTLALVLARRPRALVLALPLAIVVALVPDLFLVLPEGWSTHLGFVLFGGGSDHGAALAHHGASVWALFATDPSAPSSSVTLGPFDAQQLGWIAFALAQLVLAWRLVRARFEPRAIVLHAGATHLAMAVLLTGVHERYLAHGGAWLIVALAGRLRGPLAIGAVAATGLYVIASVSWEAFPPWLREAELAGTLQLWLLIACLALPFPRDVRGPIRELDGQTPDSARALVSHAASSPRA